MSKFIRMPTINHGLSYYLNRVNPGSATIYNRCFSSSSSEELLRYTSVMDLPKENYGEVVGRLSNLIGERSGGGNNSRKLDLVNPYVLKTRAMDVELTEEDRYGKIILASEDDINIRYGDCGFAPSASIKPTDLLKYQIKIRGGSFGVLDTKHHTPFLIEVANPERVFAMAINNIVRVEEYSRKEVEGSCSINPRLDLPEDLARRLHIKIQDKIFSDHRNERFFEEVTLLSSPPTPINPSSMTYMNFERRKYGMDNSTDSHYHPGDRMLDVLTISKEAGVKLNFCGINENPEERKDCEVVLNFPLNSFVTVKFPAYCHHKFYGDFVCVSIHPQDGPNIIEAVKNGTLPKGFLESATVFSSKEKDNKWIVTAPQQSHSQNDKEKTR